LHLSPGVRHADDRRPAWTLADVAPDFRARYRHPQTAVESQNRPDESTAVELDCRDCHVTVADKSAGLGAGADVSLVDFNSLPRNQPPLATGAYMLPVKFAEHCQGCHPLAIERWAGGDAHANEVPHGVQGQALRQLLAGRFFQKTTGPTTKAARIRPLPGESPGRISREVETTVESRVRRAETHLRDAACKKCHESDAAADSNGPISIEPVNMPVVWLQKAYFNHRAHRSIFDKSVFDKSVEDGCLECHDARSSTKASDVLIDGIAKCRECHAPQAVLHQFTAGAAGARQKTGADYRCVECHRYHRADLAASDSAARYVHDRAQQSAAQSQEANRASEE
jgi:predicted CXXCH cytochrome family protein